jgi:hypothetical protein
MVDPIFDYQFRLILIGNNNIPGLSSYFLVSLSYLDAKFLFLGHANQRVTRTVILTIKKKKYFTVNAYTRTDLDVIYLVPTLQYGFRKRQKFTHRDDSD